MFDKEIFSKRLLDAINSRSTRYADSVIDSAGISYDRFMSLCNAEEEPTISELCKLSEVLHVPTDCLLGISNEHNISSELEIQLDKLIRRYKHKLERTEARREIELMRQVCKVVALTYEELERFLIRENKYEESSNLSVHGYWSKGWYSARAHTLDDIIEDLKVLKDSL